MPARKNRPGKHGSEGRRSPQLNADSAEQRLVEKLITCERANPTRDHYVDWADMSAAERLIKNGHLREGGQATGCFVVTEKFRRNFMQP